MEEISRSITGPSAANGGVILNIWIFFQVASGSIGLPILVFTFLIAKNVQRHPMLINMCITWIVAGVSSTLLLYARQERGREPTKSLCIAQSALLYGVPPMTSLSAFAVVYQVWTCLTSMSRIEPKKGKAVMYFMLILPYLALISFAIATTMVAARDPSKVTRSRRFFYCSLEFGKLSNAMGVVAAIICFATVILEAHIAFLLSRNFRGLRHAPEGRPHPSWRTLDVQLIGRIFVFSGYLVIALVFSAISILSPRTIVPDMFAATMGMAVFLIFGTQPDVLRTWAFWLPKRKSREAETYHSSPREGNYLDSNLTFEFTSTSSSSSFSSGRKAESKGSDPFAETYDLRDSDSLYASKGSRWSTATDDIERMPKVEAAKGSGGVMVPRLPPFSVIKRPEDAFARGKRKSVVMQYGLAL